MYDEITVRFQCLTMAVEMVKAGKAEDAVAVAQRLFDFAWNEKMAERAKAEMNRIGLNQSSGAAVLGRAS